MPERKREKPYSYKEKQFFAFLMILSVWNLSLVSILTKNEKVLIYTIIPIFLLEFICQDSKRNQRKKVLETEKIDLEVAKKLSEMKVSEELREQIRETKIENYRKALIQRNISGDFLTAEEEILLECKFFEEIIFEVLAEVFVLENEKSPSSRIYAQSRSPIYQKFAKFSEKNWETNISKIHSYFFINNWQTFLKTNLSPDLYVHFTKLVDQKMEKASYKKPFEIY